MVRKAKKHPEEVKVTRSSETQPKSNRKRSTKVAKKTQSTKSGAAKEKRPKVKKRRIAKISKPEVREKVEKKKVAVRRKRAVRKKVPRQKVITEITPVVEKAVPEVISKEKKVPSPVKEARPTSGIPAVTPALPKVKINELTTIRELAGKMNQPVSEILKKLLSLGTVATINQRIDRDTCALISHEFNMEIEFVPLYSEDITEIKEDAKNLLTRAPVVTVMGHVDHGKTSLLDAVRETNVIGSEAGGITQHIGAYEVKTSKGDIVFLDTPGHEAFTAMRAHGSKITDIVVLIVAADDGVMPQTIEAINHARVAGVPIIVAINKIDLPGANSKKVRQQLANYNLISDEWGGDTFTVEISAKNKTNIDKLLETILFKAELMELKTNPNCPAQGVVIEAKLDSRKGPVATVLIQKGTLNIGNSFICGITCGKVKALTNDRNERINKANSNIPVEILGFDSIPFAGDKFIVVKDNHIAREIIQKRQAIFRQERLQVRRKISLEDIAAGELKQLNIILKADVQGSVDAIRDALDRISSDKVKLNIVHFGVGAISMSDVNLAISSDAIIIGFNIRPDPNSESLAKKEGVDIRIYRVIYELIDEIKHALEGMLPPKFKEVTIGKVQVRKVFQISRVGAVAGCFVTTGKVQRSAHVRLLRDNVIVYDGTIATLRRFKDDVKEVEKGYECGIMLSNYNDIKVNDVLEVYIKEKVEQKLD